MNAWGLLHGVRRDLILYELMDWASRFHDVQLKLLVRGDHVAICSLCAQATGALG